MATLTRPAVGSHGSHSFLIMSIYKLKMVGLGVALLLVVSSHAHSTKITVDVAHPGHAIAPTLWGIFFEDINLSADGGLYPELVRNRSFEDADKPDFWQLVNAPGGESEMKIDSP